MKRRSRNRGANIFAATLAILVGLLWSGVIDAEMKWTATMFGLALMAFMVGNRD
jgi:ABC-type polysaccharide/polyol phosphate export permease